MGPEVTLGGGGRRFGGLVCFAPCAEACLQLMPGRGLIESSPGLLGAAGWAGPLPQASAGSWPTAVSLSFLVVSQTSPVSFYSVLTCPEVLFAALQKSKQNCRHVSRSSWHPALRCLFGRHTALLQSLSGECDPECPAVQSCRALGRLALRPVCRGARAGGGGTV